MFFRTGLACFRKSVLNHLLSTTAWRHSRRVPVMNRPACSPDLSPGDNIWSIIKKEYLTLLSNWKLYYLHVKQAIKLEKSGKLWQHASAFQCRFLHSEKSLTVGEVFFSCSTWSLTFCFLSDLFRIMMKLLQHSVNNVFCFSRVSPMYNNGFSVHLIFLPFTRIISGVFIVSVFIRNIFLTRADI